MEQVTSHDRLRLYEDLMCSSFGNLASNCRSKSLHCHYVSNCVICRLQEHNSLGPTPYPDNGRDSPHKLLVAHKGVWLRGWKWGIRLCTCDLPNNQNKCLRSLHPLDCKIFPRYWPPDTFWCPNGAIFRYANIILCFIWNVNTLTRSKFSPF